jgi:type I restriction enzyme S subunit
MAPGAAMKKGWTWKPLGEVCKTGSGGTPLSSRKEYYDGGDVPWLLSGEVAQGNVREAKNFITKAGLENSAAKLFPKDTVLVAMYGATAGQVGILRFEAATNQAVCGILPNDKFVPEFLFYFLLAKKDELVAQATGNAQPNISQIKIKNTEVPVPPLSEQQRIVGVLDEAFDGLATAKANAEKSLQNARALFESHLQSVFTQRGPGWTEKRLGDVATRLTNGYVGPTRNIYHDSGVPYLLARHVKDNHLQFDGKTFITEEFNRKNKKSMLKTGDVLLVQSGHIGHSAVVTEEHEGHNCHAMIVITAAEGAFIGPFLSLFFNTSRMKQKFQEIRSGSTVPHLTCGEVKELQIPLPDLKTQTSVVDHSRELSQEIKRLAAIYEQKLAALEALKKSLLHQAFSGEL